MHHQFIVSADQTRPDQNRTNQFRPDQRRLPSRGPNSKTCVLVQPVRCYSVIAVLMQLKANHTASQTTLFKIYMYEQFCQGNFWWAGFVNRLLCHTNAQMLWHIGAHIYAFAVNPSHRFAWGWSWICQLAVVDKLLCHTLSTRVLWHIGVHTYSLNCQPTQKDGRSDAP